MKVTTNAVDVLSDMVKQLNRIENITPYNLEMAAETGRDSVVDRIQNQGVNSAGEAMESSSAKKLGRYSYSHGRRREKRGLKTNIVNLTYTGEMVDSFRLLDRSPKEVTVGFDAQGAADIAGYNAERFGVSFNMNDSEEQQATDRFLSLFNGFIK